MFLVTKHDFIIYILCIIYIKATVLLKATYLEQTSKMMGLKHFVTSTVLNDISILCLFLYVCLCYV